MSSAAGPAATAGGDRGELEVLADMVDARELWSPCVFYSMDLAKVSTAHTVGH